MYINILYKQDLNTKMRKDSGDSFEDNEQNKLTPELTFFLMECGYVNIINCGTIENAIVLLGNTKAGKTTLLHAMAHSDLVGAKNDFDKVVYKAREVKENLANALIGDRQRHSETQIPNIVNIEIGTQKVSVVDLPGFLDTFGCYRSISNRFFTRTIFSKIKNVKFVIVASFTDLERTAGNFVKTVESFFRLFNNYHKKIEEISQYVSLVITGVPENIDQKKLTKAIETVQMSIEQDRKCYKILVKQLKKNKRVIKFEAAVLEKPINQNLNFEGRINSSIPKWYKLTNVKDMRITVTDALNVSQDRTFMKELKPFSDYIEKIFNSTFIELLHEKILLNFIENVDTQAQVYFEGQLGPKDKSEQYQALEKKYKARRAKQSDKLYESILNKNKEGSVQQQNSKQLILSLEKMKIFKKFTEICKEVNTDEQEDKNHVYLDEFQKILGLFVGLLKKKSQDTEKVKFFTFDLVLRLKILVEIYEIFKISCQQAGFFNKEGKVLPSQLDYIIGDLSAKISSIFVFERFEFIKRSLKYLKQLKLNEIPNNCQVYSKYKLFIHQIKQKIISTSDLELRQENIDKNNRKQIVSQLEQKQQYFEYKILEWMIYNNKSENTLEQLEKKRKQYINKSLEAPDNEQGDKKRQLYLSNVMKILHLMCYQAKKEDKIDLLLKLYEALNDGYNVIQIYKSKEEALSKGFDLKNQKHKEEMMKLLKQFMEKAFKFDRIHLAIQKGQRAYSLAQNLGDAENIQKISKFLFQISPSFKHSSPENKFIDRLFQQRSIYQLTMEQGFTFIDVEQEHIKLLMNKK